MEVLACELPWECGDVVSGHIVVNGLGTVGMPRNTEGCAVCRRSMKVGMAVGASGNAFIGCDGFVRWILGGTGDLHTAFHLNHRHFLKVRR